MVCQIFHRAFGQKKPQDSDGVNLYCRHQAYHLVFRHLQQLYDDLNGSSFHQTLGPANQLNGTLAENQLPLAQLDNQLPVAQPPIAQPVDQLPLTQPINELHFSPFNDTLPLDESSRRQSLLQDSYSTNYYTASAQTFSHIRQWLQESGLVQSSEDSTPPQPTLPHITVLQPTSPRESPRETQNRTPNLSQENVQTQNLQGAAKRDTSIGSLNKRLPELPTMSRTDMTMQDIITDPSHSRNLSHSISGHLRTQEADPSIPLKNDPKPRTNSTIAPASTSNEENHPVFKQDLGLLNDIIVIQVDFCGLLLARIFSTETLPVQGSLKKLTDLLRQKSPEELQKIGLLELEKLYSRCTRLSDRIKRSNVKSVRKLCEEVNPTVKVWIDKLQVNQVGRLPVGLDNKETDERNQVRSLSDISDTSEGVVGMQARRIGMTAKQIGKLKEKDVENLLKTALHASGTGPELPYVTQQFRYLRKNHLLGLPF